ncbi:MAG: nucleoside triphosphate pyrophosphohydrolase family protein [Trueperaceae bacterium]
MTLSEYHDRARATALYPDEAALLYPVLKLSGEAGEVAEKLGKAMRDRDWRPGRPLPDQVRHDLIAELGDVLWYVASVAADLGTDLPTVAERNLDKLAGRKERGTLHGSGDDR